MSEIVVTIKAGTGYDVPWVVFHGESIEEVSYHLDNADELISKVNFLSKKFAQSYINTPNGVAELIKQELGGEVISIEPVTAVSAPETKPWERPKQQSAGGWAPPPPVERDFYTVEVPTRELDDWKVQRAQFPKGTFDWDADLKRNTIKKNADPNILTYLRDVLKRELRG